MDEILTCAHSSVLSECGDVAAEWTHEFNRRRFIEIIELLRCDVTSFILPGQLLCHLIVTLRTDQLSTFSDTRVIVGH